MRQITSWINPLTVCSWHQCPHADQCVQLIRSKPAGQESLHRLKNDSMAMGKVRQLLRQSDSYQQTSLCDDDQVIEKFIHLLNSGRWRICPKIETPRQFLGSTAAKVEESPPPAPAKKTLPDFVPAKHEAESTFFSSDHWAARQAEILGELAALGIPFCEECHKKSASKAVAD